MAAAAHASNAAAAALFSAAATDLRFLARFHDREPEPDDLGALARHPARSWLAVTLEGTDAGTGFDLLDAARGDFAEPGAAEALSVDHADLYLTFARRLAPNESYWLTEDHLERQEPMFAVRAIYARRGLAAENWRRRADDHLVLELEFVAHLLEMGTPDALAEAGRFLDRHLMVWSGGLPRRRRLPGRHALLHRARPGDAGVAGGAARLAGDRDRGNRFPPAASRLRSASLRTGAGGLRTRRRTGVVTGPSVK